MALAIDSNQNPQTTSTTTTSNTSGQAGVFSGATSLDKYMAEAAQLLINLISLAALNTQNNTKVGSDLISLNQALTQKAADNAQKIQEALDEQAHQSGLSKLLGEICGAILAVIGALTGDPVLCMTGIMLFTMNVSGAQDKLNASLSNLSPALQGLVNAGIAVGVAILTAGVAGVVEASFSGVEQGAASAASSGAEEAAGSDAAAAADNIAEDASASILIASEDEAGAQGGLALSGQLLKKDLEKKAAELAAEAAANGGGGNAAAAAGNADAVASAGSNPFKLALQELPSAIGQATITFNPFTGLMQGLLEACGVNDKDAELAGEIVGTVVAILFAGGMSMKYNSEAEGGLFDKISKRGAEAQKGLKAAIAERFGTKNIAAAVNFLTLVNSGLMVGSGTFEIKAGMLGLKAADLYKDDGTLLSASQLIQSVQDMLNQVVKVGQSSSDSTAATMQEENSNWAKYLAQYNEAPYMMK